MGVFSADQVRVFLAVIDEGSFSGAARALRRNQSAISYAIANLEEQLGVRLFDRSSVRPTLTAGGAALVSDARKATYSLDVMRERGAALARGIEAELSIVVDAFCPMDALVAAMRDFAQEFPMVRPHIHLELVHQAVALVLDGTCSLGMIAHPMGSRPDLDQFPSIARMDLRAYVSPDHSLGRPGVRLESDDLENHIQFILGDQQGLSAGQELGIFTSRTWVTSDLRAQLALICAGVGWGFLPSHMAEPDVETGRLVPLDLAAWPNGGAAEVRMMVVRHTDAAIGPAATWLLDRLSEKPDGPNPMALAD